MGAVGIESLSNFAGGVVTVVDAEVQPDQTLSKAHNCELFGAGAGQAYFGKRRGFDPLNHAQPPITESVSALAGYVDQTTPGVSTNWLLVHTGTGIGWYQWDRITTNATTVVSLTTALNVLFPGCTILEDQQLYDIRGRVFFKAYNATTIEAYTWGVEAPSTALTGVATTSVGSHNGTYYGKITFIDNQNQESNASPPSASVVATDNTITWAIPLYAPSALMGPGTRKLYIKGPSMVEYYLASTIVSTTATSIETNIADSQLVTPYQTGHERPPNNAIALEQYFERFFALTYDGVIYWSKIGEYGYWNTDTDWAAVGAEDEQTGAALITAWDRLFILKSKSIWVIDGQDPKTWSLTKVLNDIGHFGTKTKPNSPVFFINNQLFFWDQNVGPIAWQGPGSSPEPIGRAIQPDIDALNAALTPTTATFGAIDHTNQRILWCMDGKTILVYNYRMKVWESNKWDPFPVTAMATVMGTAGRTEVWIGSDYGNVFKLDFNHYSDGDPGGSWTNTTAITLVTTNPSTITVPGANFPTTNHGLCGRMISILTSDGIPAANSFRCVISTNSSTVLTISTSTNHPALGLTTTGAHLMVIAGPPMEVDTNWNSGGKPYHKKRFEFLYLDGISMVPAAGGKVMMEFDRNPEYGQVDAYTDAGKNTNWSATIWDTASNATHAYGTSETFLIRKRIGRTGRLWKVKIANYNFESSIKIKSIGVRSELLTDKIG